jgi:hypothetical protein
MKVTEPDRVFISDNSLVGHLSPTRKGVAVDKIELTQLDMAALPNNLPIAEIKQVIDAQDVLDARMLFSQLAKPHLVIADHPVPALNTLDLLEGIQNEFGIFVCVPREIKITQAKFLILEPVADGPTVQVVAALDPDIRLEVLGKLHQSFDASRIMDRDELFVAALPANMLVGTKDVFLHQEPP